jgi:hypothetical protein
MFVIVEMEWDYNNLDYLGVYGPYRSDKKAKQAYDKLMLNKKSFIRYEIKKIEKLNIKA